MSPALNACCAGGAASTAQPIITLRHQNKPASCFSTGHLLVGRTSVGERNHPIDHGRPEGTIVEEGCERLEQDRRCGRIALARVDPEQPALMMIEVNKVEADPAVTRRCDLDLSAARS